MATTKRKEKRGAKGSRAGQQLVDATRELADALERGDHSTLTVRKIEVPEPGKYSPADVKSLRERLDVSQPIFAKLVGVSSELARQWEYGIRTPSPMARRLMDIVRADPSGYLASFVRTRVVAAK